MVTFSSTTLKTWKQYNCARKTCEKFTSSIQHNIKYILPTFGTIHKPIVQALKLYFYCQPTEILYTLHCTSIISMQIETIHATASTQT